MYSKIFYCLVELSNVYRNCKMSKKIIFTPIQFLVFLRQNTRVYLSFSTNCPVFQRQTVSSRNLDILGAYELSLDKDGILIYVLMYWYYLRYIILWWRNPPTIRFVAGSSPVTGAYLYLSLVSILNRFTYIYPWSVSSCGFDLTLGRHP